MRSFGAAIRSPPRRETRSCSGAASPCDRAMVPCRCCRFRRRWRTMTRAAGTEAPPRIETGKSLKDQNRWQLWIIVAANTLFLYGVVQANAIKIDGLRGVFTDAQNLLPV